MIRVYVPRDAAALSVGADDIAHAIAAEAGPRGAEIRLVRNGSRGMLWLEPLVEVETPQGRIAYGPVTLEDVRDLFDSGFLQGGDHPLRLGPTEQIPYFRNQQRLTFARCGVTDPVSLDDYLAYGGEQGARDAGRMRQEGRDYVVADGDVMLFRFNV